MNSLFIIFIAFSITEIATDDILNKIGAYFDSQAAKSFDEQWKIHQIPFEHSLSMALQEGYGYKSMNVYINRFQDPLDVSIGYYHTDNQVQIVFQNLGLEELPHIYDADIIFPLSSNALSVDASVSKMVVHGSYILFRNKSDIIFSVADQDSYKSSPFRFQQVRNIGEVAITIDACTLSGILIATLSGGSVNLGHSQLKLTGCEYTLEIYSLGMGAPPVIAHYLPEGKKHLVMRPLLEELVPKLQAAMFSHINTSSLFTKDLSNIRATQEDVFEETHNYMDQEVREMNRISMEKNMGTINLEDFHIAWDDVFDQFPQSTSMSLSDMVLMGLDTLYSAHTGGPFRLTETEIAEQLRFSTLEVVGKFSIKGFQDDNEFAVQISDFAVDVILDSRLKPKFEVVGWRFFEFSCPAMEFLPVESFVIGYLLNEIPKRIVSHLNSVFNGGTLQLSLTASVKNEGDTAEILLYQDGEEKQELMFELFDKDIHELVALENNIESQEKTNLLEETPNEEEHGIVKLKNIINIVPQNDDIERAVANLASIAVQEQLKLQNIVASPLEEGADLVKLHHVARTSNVKSKNLSKSESSKKQRLRLPWIYETRRS